ncbi:hypothetical protein [Hymenobacter terrigena]
MLFRCALIAAGSGLARAQTASAEGRPAAPASPTTYFTAEEMPAFSGAMRRW